MAAFQQVRTASPATPAVSTIVNHTELEMRGYREVVARTVEAFGDEMKASRWLSLPNHDLNGQTPLQAVQKSGYDVRVLEPILIRIEHGVAY